MYSYIKGFVSEIGPKCIVIETNKIGYEVVVANPYDYKVSDLETTIYLYHNVRDDAEVLYGFKDKDSKDLFLKLISVNGIGPKTALSILAYAGSSEIISAIEGQNADYLKKFPGIGAKASQQIILDLKGKINFEDKSLHNQKTLDITEALITLGYKKAQVKKVINKLDMSLSDSLIIKEALKLLNK